MKTKFFLSALVLLFVCSMSYAKIRRVGYNGPAVAGTDYADFQSAHDAAGVLDTIMLYPGGYSGSMNKKLIVIGPGYYLTGPGANVNLQNLSGTVSFSCYLTTGSDSCIFEGIDNFQLLANDAVSKIIVRRCLAGISFFSGAYADWKVSQSSVYFSNYNAGTTGQITNLTVTNCYVQGVNFYANGGTISGQFTNNVISSVNCGSGSFLNKNNIYVGSRGGDENCIYQNCISMASNPLPVGNNNQNIPDADMLDNVFVGWGTQGTFSNDGRFALKAGSPAIGAGMGGIDCGMFGGTNPYKLSGIPRVPAFYKLTAPSNTTSTNPYTITFSVRSNN